MSSCIDEELSSRAQAVIEHLRAARLSVVTAESCTAGLIAAVLSYGTGALDCLHGGFVVYTKEQKNRALGVERAVLQERGSVNEAVALQMAEGALRRSQASMAISVTGVLGPDPDEDGNPAGLVLLGLAKAGEATAISKHHFEPTHPDFVRKRTVLQALHMLSARVE